VAIQGIIIELRSNEKLFCSFIQDSQGTRLGKTPVLQEQMVERIDP
jgi:hypothetical protein